MIGLSDLPLDVAAVCATVADDEHGGTAVFVGSTRAERDVRHVTALEYEAFATMAVAEMEHIASHVSRCHGARLAMVHRLGVVDVGEPAVVVAASAPHRAAAFEACRDAVDRLKADVPIWKRVHHADGTAAWA